MLDNYLESNIIDQKNILAILLADTNTSLDKICAKTHLSPKQVKHYITQMNNLFQKSLQLPLLKQKFVVTPAKLLKKPYLMIFFPYQTRSNYCDFY
ncbi:helix-turn-helix domain-containing protein [Streptococcus phocae subsp. phocae]